MLEDKDFIKSCDVPGPTKEAIRAILLYKSGVSAEDRVVDCGCGTGGLTCEFSQRAKEVISIDTNPEAIEVTSKNLKQFGLGDNVTLINDDGANALKDIDDIDIAIVGGSGRQLENILDIVHEKLNSKGRILITAILVDTKVEAINKLKDLGYNPKIMEVNVSNGRVLDRGILMISENPIAIITAKKDEIGDYKMDSHKRWKIKFSILMIVLIIIIYGSNYLVLGDAEHIISYIWTHLGFIPVDILIVAFLLDEIIERKEKEAILEKLDMLMSTFFSEVGNELISQLSNANKYKASTENLKSIKNWEDKDYENKLEELKASPVDFSADIAPEDREEFLENLRTLLAGKREFIINLINNPNLLEKEDFTELINSILHLDEELEHRSDLALVNDTDFGHLNGDMNRVYNKLVYEWVYYLKYLNKHYPYMIALIIRTNPFDEDADVYVK